MEYRVEGRRPVGRPRKTKKDMVRECRSAVDMAELEIDKEDVHDRSKWRRIVNVMKRKSNPIGKRTINRYYSDYHLNSIYIYYCYIWLVGFCYVIMYTISVYFKFMCIYMY